MSDSRQVCPVIVFMSLSAHLLRMQIATILWAMGRLTPKRTGMSRNLCSALIRRLAEFNGQVRAQRLPNFHEIVEDNADCWHSRNRSSLEISVSQCSDTSTVMAYPVAPNLSTAHKDLGVASACTSVHRIRSFCTIRLPVLNLFTNYLQDIMFLAVASSKLRLVNESLPLALAAELEARGITAATNTRELAQTVQALAQAGCVTPALSSFLETATQEQRALFEKWQLKVIAQAIKAARSQSRPKPASSREPSSS